MKYLFISFLVLTLQSQIRPLYQKKYKVVKSELCRCLTFVHTTWLLSLDETKSIYVRFDKEYKVGDTIIVKDDRIFYYKGLEIEGKDMELKEVKLDNIIDVSLARSYSGLIHQSYKLKSGVRFSAELQQ